MDKNAALAVLFLAVAVSGCTQSSVAPQQGSGSFELLISDQPTEIDNFDYVNVTFSEVRVYESGNSTNSSENFTSIQLEDSPTVDLTYLKGDRAASIIQQELDAGNYSSVHLQVSDVQASIDNESANVKIPSERLQINKPFEISANSTTEFVFDINVVKRGQSGSYNLLPVISESGVAGQDVEVERVSRSRESGNTSQGQQNIPSQGQQ